MFVAEVVAVDAEANEVDVNADVDEVKIEFVDCEEVIV